MNLNEAYIMANNLMAEHNLLISGWHFEFDSAKRRFGCCRYNTKRISLSKHLVKLNSVEQVKDTILHEIAHALVGHANGHNHVWKQKALSIGCNGNRCYNNSEVVTPKSKYWAICPGCGYEHKSHKKRRLESSCGKCSNGKFNRDFLLVWEQNY